VTKFQESILGRSLGLLTRADHIKLFILTFAQIFLSFLDLLGVAIVGLLGSLAVSGIEAKHPVGRVASLINFIRLQNHSVQYQAAALGLAAGLTLIIRTLLSVFFTRRTMFFLGRRGAAISADITGRLFSQPLLEIQKRTTQQTIFALTTGINTVILGIVSGATSLLSDLVLLVVMTAGLLLVAPILAVSLLTFFGLVGFALYKLMHKKMRGLGGLDAQNIVETNEVLQEALDSYRESIVRNRRGFYLKNIIDLRYNQANFSAELAFLPLISKYVIESSVVFGALLICAIQFTITDARHAVGTLAIFLAASTRIAPAVLRVQQGALGIRGAYGSASPSLDLIESLHNVAPLQLEFDETSFNHQGFTGSVSARNINFTYPAATKQTIKNLSLEIPTGATYAIVGSSGAGKTTLVDILLGVIEPDSGSVEISGRSPSEVVKKWPGAISYVPQSVVISNRSIRENVSLGYPTEQVTDVQIMEALRVAQMESFLADQPNGLDTIVGERGTRLSGGQRQRIGIARAVFTKPRLLILDEATSALDGQTENEVSLAINGLRGSTTLIIIAHRLSTVRLADQIIYMENGEIRAQGTFTELRKLVPDFESQAQLAGM
jgi:ATP-binding cassette, subfamily B, bacterial PglK